MQVSVIRPQLQIHSSLVQSESGQFAPLGRLDVDSLRWPCALELESPEIAYDLRCFARMQLDRRHPTSRKSFGDHSREVGIRAAARSPHDRQSQFAAQAIRAVTHGTMKLEEILARRSRLLPGNRPGKNQNGNSNRSAHKKCVH